MGSWIVFNILNDRIKHTRLINCNGHGNILYHYGANEIGSVENMHVMPIAMLQPNVTWNCTFMRQGSQVVLLEGAAVLSCETRGKKSTNI